MEYFPKRDDTFMNYWEILDKALVKNSYTNNKTCISTENTRKRKISLILDTETTHATDSDEKSLHNKI